MVSSSTRVTAADWPGLLTLKFPVENALSAGLQGRSGVIRGTDPAPAAGSETADETTPAPANNPIIPDFLEFGIGDKIEGLFRNTIIAFVGIVILAIGLFALVLQAKGAV